LISVISEEDEVVFEWVHVEKSHRTTIWLARMKETDQIQPTLREVEALGCRTVQLVQCGVSGKHAACFSLA
jgi:hypothetical protein